MIGREDTHHGVRVDGLQDMRRESNGGSRVALGRLGQDLGFGNLGQLAHDLGAQMVIAENPNTFGRKNGPQSIHGLLDQGALAAEAQHLLGVAAAAARPKARAAAASQNQAVVAGVAAHPPSGYP